MVSRAMRASFCGLCGRGMFEKHHRNERDWHNFCDYCDVNFLGRIDGSYRIDDEWIGGDYAKRRCFVGFEQRNSDCDRSASCYRRCLVVGSSDCGDHCDNSTTTAAEIDTVEHGDDSKHSGRRATRSAVRDW